MITSAKGEAFVLCFKIIHSTQKIKDSLDVFKLCDK
jgi:hypothetical protein